MNNHPANLPQGLSVGGQHLMPQGFNSEDLAKIVNQIQPKGPGANFNGAHYAPEAGPQGHGQQRKSGSNSGGGSDGESEDGSGTGDDKNKSKRRSKNDVDGRDFKCKYCDKTYLSYPALYTHMK